MTSDFNSRLCVYPLFDFYSFFLFSLHLMKQFVGEKRFWKLLRDCSVLCNVAGNLLLNDVESVVRTNMG